MIVLHTTERNYTWGALRSNNASTIKVVLEEKGLQYRIENLRPGDLWKKPPEMLVKHLLGKIPYIEVDGAVVFDSTVINESLEDRYPTPTLMPGAPMSRARVRMFENLGDEAVLVGDLPAIWMPYWSPPEQRDPEKMEKGRDGLRKRALPYIEQQLDDRAYLAGAFSLADAPYMAMAMVLEVDEMNLEAFPRVAGYLRRLREWPSYRATSSRTPVN